MKTTWTDIGGVREETIELADASLWTADSGGDGPAVVLLHAYAGSGQSFSRQIDPIRAAGYRVITYSRRGHLGSTGASADGLPPASEDLRALLQRLGLGAVHLVGTAGGGFVAADYALTWPEQVRTLTLACTMIGIEDADYLQLCADNRPAGFESMTMEERELSDEFRSQQPADVGRWRRNLPLDRPPVPATRTPITWANLERLTMPVMLLCGEEDPYFPPAVMKAVAARFPVSGNAVVPGTGHSMYWEKPEAFNDLVLGFLRSADRRGEP